MPAGNTAMKGPTVRSDPGPSVPSHVPALLEQAIALHRSGRLVAAQALYERIVSIDPTHSDALQLLGTIAGQRNDPERALLLLNKALETHPHSPNGFVVHCNKGSALKLLGRLEAAVASYGESIALNPRYATAHLNKGIVLRELRRLDAALASYDCAIAIAPELAEAHYGRGNVLCDLGRPREAVASYDRALTIRAAYAEAHSGRGNALRALGILQEALASYDRAIALKPEAAEFYVNRAILRLLCGDFQRGLLDFEWRWKNPLGTNIKEQRSFSQPLWLGEEALAGKRILIYCEQGFGDTIQFCRYGKLLAERGATVLMEVQQPLVSLLRGLSGVSQLIGRGDPLPEFDVHCPMLSLPLALKTSASTIPAARAYLSSDPTRVSEWRSRLTARKPQVGLTWSGNPLYPQEHYRRISLAELVPHLPPQFQYVCLQRDVREADQKVLHQHPEILNFADELTDFADTAALCDCMDVVISVDTSSAHLSAALGKPTWILLSASPDWRWLLGRADSPWYPSARLFRQHSIGDWSQVLEEVTANLTRVLERFTARDGPG